MSSKLSSASFREMLLSGTPLIDVRAEVEFQAGTLPGAVNLPILTTDERARVGLCYKQQGADEAIALGHQLVGGELKERRISAWAGFARANPGCAVFCWRGGMRSGLAGQWMAEAGCEVPVIEGGFKAVRGYLMQFTAQVARDVPLLLIAGRTGSAKTRLVGELDTGIDLEGHANHRGSSFGRNVTEPPGQIDFEHRLALDLLARTERYPDRTLFLEDESRRIGPVSIPLELHRAMSTAPMALVDMPLSRRIDRILQEYVVDLRRQHEALDAETGFTNFQRHLLDSLERIQKRLGGVRYRELSQSMRQAFEAQLGGDVDAHRHWIERLLIEYYDPMYEYQLSQVGDRVAFQGDYAAVLGWCQEQR